MGGWHNFLTSIFFDDPVNGLRLEYTTRLAEPGDADRDPEIRQFPVSLSLFREATSPGSTLSAKQA